MSVETIIATQQQFALDAATSADAIVDNLADLSTGSFIVIPGPGAPDFTWDATEDTQALLLSLFPAVPSFNDIEAVAPSFTPTDVGTLADVPIPDFTQVAPTLEIPTTPSSALPTAPTAPALTDPVLPSAPVLSMPTAPVLTAITLPDVPSIEIPAFTSTLPIDDLVTPTNNFEFYEVAYASELLDELKAKLLYDLQNGGYGIETADEAAMLDRARTRELENALTQMDTIMVDGASRGFPLPPGDITVALQRAQQALQNAVSGVSRDIYIKRADQFVENRKFTIEQAKQLEQILIGYHNSVMERALNAAKAVLEAAIRIFDAQVARYNARLDTYKTDAQVFEARVRAALAQTEVYKVTMEGKRIEGDLQRNQVELYNAQLNGVTTVVNLYKVQMEAAQVQAGIERLRIDAFRALIEAYTSQVQAKVAEFNMFESQIKGEVAKVNAFESQVKAYVATVDGAKAKTDVLVQRLKAEIEVAQQAIEVYKAQALVYKTDIDAQAQTIDAQTKVYGSQVQGASAQANAIGEARRLDLSAREIQSRVTLKNADIAIEQAKILLQSLVASAEINVKAGGYAADYYKALIGGAVNSINTLSSLVTTE